MTPDELRAIMEFLRGRVSVTEGGASSQAVVQFDAPTVDEMARAGLDAEGVQQVRDAPWWDEMASDIVETPEMCDPGDPAEQVLQYAQDVVSEYIRKRAKL